MPTHFPVAPMPVPPAAGLQPRVVAGPATGHAVAVFGGVERKGRWIVPTDMNLTTVMGGADLDLTDASFASREVTIKVFALFGGAQITVPGDVQVINDVFAISAAWTTRRPRPRHPVRRCSA